MGNWGHNRHDKETKILLRYELMACTYFLSVLPQCFTGRVKFTKKKILKPFLVRWRNSVYICSEQDWFKRKLGTEILLRYELNLCTGVLHYQGLQWNEFPKSLYKICASERVSVTFSPEQDWCKRKLGHNRHNKETKMT